MQWLTSTWTRIVAMLALLTVLSGCKEVLYSELSEADANEMVALLVLSGIPASREKDTNNTYALKVEPADLAIAVTVLKNSGLPREKYASLGEVFGDSGVVGTPFEERVRFAHAINEELAHTISQIKGVERARVHSVVPLEDRFGKSKEKARAAVAIFHDKSFDPAENSGRIKTLVAYAVPELKVEDVSLSFFLAPGFVVQPTAVTQDVPGSAMAASPLSQRFGGDLSGGFLFILAGLLLGLLLLVRGVMLYSRRLRSMWSAK